MIGSGLKKLAAEHNMKVSNGVAYGNLRGYAATLSEGAGWKKIAFSTMFPDAAQKGLFIEAVNTVDTQKIYRVRHLGITPKGIVVDFLDNPGTMKKMREFLDWFVPMLAQYGATQADICVECGTQLTDRCWELIDGIAHCMHNTCAEKVSREIADNNETRKEEALGSYGTGLVGALIGATIGAVLWAIVLNLGYVASIVGLVIGFLAEKGYNLLRGKQGKGKIAILIVSIIFGVVVGTFAADVFTLASMINNGEILLTYGDIPRMLMTLLAEDAEYVSAVTSNILMGLLFAGIGVFALLRKAGKEVADTKVIDLN